MPSDVTQDEFEQSMAAVMATLDSLNSHVSELFTITKDLDSTGKSEYSYMLVPTPARVYRSSVDMLYLKVLNANFMI